MDVKQQRGVRRDGVAVATAGVRTQQFTSVNAPMCADRRMGFVQWRMAVYVAGQDEQCVVKMLGVLCRYAQWRCRSAEFAGRGELEVRLLAPDLRVPLHAGIAEAHGWTVAAGAAAVSLEAPHVFDAQPPRGRRGLVVTVEHDEDANVSIMFSGATFGFRDRFDVAGVAGGYVDTESVGREYVRLLRAVRTDVPEDVQRALRLLGDDVLRGHAVLLVVDFVVADEHVNGFLRQLKALDSVHVR